MEENDGSTSGLEIEVCESFQGNHMTDGWRSDKSSFLLWLLLLLLLLLLLPKRGKTAFGEIELSFTRRPDAHKTYAGSCCYCSLLSCFKHNRTNG